MLLSSQRRFLHKHSERGYCTQHGKLNDYPHGFSFEPGNR
jgi:hypothetical protein